MIRLVAGLTVVAALGCAADRDMQRAIAWERFKDQAAARQAARERRHPSVTYDRNNSANRSADDETQGTKVKDPGSRDYRVSQKNAEKK